MGKSKQKKSSSGNWIIPNSFQMPNVFVDKLMSLLTSEEWKVLCFAVRRILGYQDNISSRRDNIAVSQFVRCGLSRTAIMRALHSLAGFNVLIPIGSASTDGQLYELQVDGGAIAWELLETRRATARQSQADRTEAARRSVGQTASLSDRPLVSGTDRASVAQTAVGLWDRPEAVCGTDTQNPSSKPSTKPKDIQATPGNGSKVTWLTPFFDLWKNQYGGEIPVGQACKALKPLVDKHGSPTVEKHFRNYLQTTAASYASVSKFAQTFGSWETSSGKHRQGVLGDVSQYDDINVRV